MIEHESIVIDWCHKLRKERYPRFNGLVETNILFRENTPKINCFNALWWKCIDNYSRRDQLSYNYCLWRRGLPLVYFSGSGNNARNTKNFMLIQHNDLSHNHLALKKNEAWLMRYCWKKPESYNKIEELYFRLYGLPFPKIAFAIMGQLFRLKFFHERLWKTV